MAGDGDSSDRCENTNVSFPEVYKKGKALGITLSHGSADDAVDEYNAYTVKLSERSKSDPDVARKMFAEFIAGMKCGDPVDVHLNQTDGLDDPNIDFTAENFVSSVFGILNKSKTPSNLEQSKEPPMAPEQAAATVTQILHSEMIENQVNDPVTRDDIVKDFNRLSKENNLPNFKASEENGTVTIQYVGTDL